MSFEVIASSRVEERRASSWRLVILTGLELGGTGIALAMVGILSMFNARPIIVGLLTLGYATLGTLLLLAGLIVGSRRAFPALPQLIVGGAVAGGIAVVLVVILPLVMSLVSLRFIFLALDKPLFDMLTFTLQPVALGSASLVALGIVLGILGVLMVALPQTIRRPIAA